MNRRRISRELAVGLVLLVTIIGSGAGIAVYRNAHAHAGLSIAASALDFGTAWGQRRFVWTVPLRNGSDRPIAVEDVQVSCRCTSVSPRQFTVPPGGSVPLALTLDLTTAFDGASVAQADFSVELQPVLAHGPVALAAWHLHGNVVRPLVFRPERVEIEMVRGEPGAPIEVRVEPRVPLEGMQILPPWVSLRLRSPRRTRDKFQEGCGSFRRCSRTSACCTTISGFRFRSRRPARWFHMGRPERTIRWLCFCRFG